MPQVILQESKILMSKPFFEPQWPGPVFLCNLTAGGTIKNGDMSFLLLWNVTKSLASARMFPMFF